MKRREFLLATLLSAPAMRHALAQQPAPKKRLAVIGIGKPEDMKIGRDPGATVFLEELKRLGFVEDENLIIDRWQFQPGRVEEIAREVIDKNPDVISCSGTPMALRLKATTTIPIVAFTGDPIRLGLVSNLARPGGNVTGVSVDAGLEVWAKRLELLSNAVPKLANVVFVSGEGVWTGAGGQAVRGAAQKLGISLVEGTVSRPYGETEYRSTFSSIQRDQVDGVIFSDEGNLHRPRTPFLLQVMQQMRLPAVYPYSEMAKAGGLMSYAADLNSLVLRYVRQIAEILRGANPGEIPYFQAERFELVINLKTAKSLGLEVPTALLARADELIE